MNIKVKKVRDYNWDDYGISRKLQLELKAFCEQYEDKKAFVRSRKKQKDVRSGNRRMHPMQWQNQLAEQCRVYSADINMIEAAAKASNEEIANYLIKSVTKDISYEYLEFDRYLERITVGKTDFYGYRRRFYYYLYRMKICGTTTIQLLES